MVTSAPALAAALAPALAAALAAALALGHRDLGARCGRAEPFALRLGHTHGVVKGAYEAVA